CVGFQHTVAPALRGVTDRRASQFDERRWTVEVIRATVFTNVFVSTFATAKLHLEKHYFVLSIHALPCFCSLLRTVDNPQMIPHKTMRDRVIRFLNLRKNVLNKIILSCPL